MAISDTGAAASHALMDRINNSALAANFIIFIPKSQLRSKKRRRSGAVSFSECAAYSE
jgi:hypothetical protein